MKKGCLIGTDKYGNRYYENPYYFYGRNRWVEYADHIHMNYDGSQIPAEWFGWMHYKVIISLSKEKGYKLRHEKSCCYRRIYPQLVMDQELNTSG